MITDRERLLRLPAGRAGGLRRGLCALLAVVMLAALAPGASAAEATTATASAATTAPATQAPVPAAPERVLRVELRGAESTLDPAQATDVYSLPLIQAIYETPVAYAYLDRPLRPVPGLLAGLPESRDGGLTWRLTLRAGLHFAPHALFGADGGASRPITAEDLRFSLGRLADPALRSPYRWLWTEHLQTVTVRDALHLEIRLQRPDPAFPTLLTLAACSVVPREVVERAPGGLAAHPVGSGPYRLTQWVRGHHLTLLANPAYRARHWQSAGSPVRPEEPDAPVAAAGPGTAAIPGLARMAGRPIPAIGRIEVQVIEEPQTAWLTFRQGGLDLLWLQDVLAPAVLPHLPPRVRLAQMPNPVLNYFVFNMRDAQFGGAQPDRVALRRAVLMAIDDRAYIRTVREGQAVPQAWPVPDGLIDAWPGYHSLLRYDPATARALLDQFGFHPCAAALPGLRCWPDGRPLELRVSSRANSQGRSEEEFLRRALAHIGVRLRAQPLQVAEFIKAARACQLQFTRADWFADVPMGTDFFQLLSARRVGAANYSCFDDAGWQTDFDRAAQIDAPQARRLAYANLARRAEVLGIWKPSHASLRNLLVDTRVLGYLPHPFYWSVWQYLDVETP